MLQTQDSIYNNLEQVPDSTVNSILRVDTSPFFQFNVEPDSIPQDTVVIDTTPKIVKPVYIPRAVVKKPVFNKDSIENLFTSPPTYSLFYDKIINRKEDLSSIEIPKIIQEDSIKIDTIEKQDSVQLIDTLAKDSIQIDTFLQTKIDTVRTKQITEIPLVKEDIAKEQIYPNWMIGVLLVLFILWAWVKVLFNKNLKLLTKSIYNYRVAYTIFKDNQSPFIISFLLNLIFVISFGLLVYQILEYNNIRIFNYNSTPTFFIYTGLVIIIYAVKYITNVLMGFIFKIPETITEYLYNVFLYNRFLGILFIPVVLLLPAIQNNDIVFFIAIFISMTIFAIFYLARIIRGLQICSKINISYFYLILYLCVLEIIPILVLYKFLKALV